MSKAKPELLKKLSKYSKEEIIQAIGQQWDGEYFIKGVLVDLEEKARDKVFKDHDKALKNLIAAREAYIKWKNEICAKHGDGKTVKLSAIPQEEIIHGANLEKALIEATETEQRLSNKIDKLLKLGD